jgi:hypothetical protein
MRGKTQLEQNKSKDRNANGRVDPFHMPTELADGLEAESLPRVVRPRLAPAEIPASREGGRLDDACTIAGHSGPHCACVGFSAPRLVPKA